MAVFDDKETSGMIPIAAINESKSSHSAKRSGERFGGDREMADVWRHPDIIGLELFRGVYTSYQAARHFHLGPAIGIVSRGAMKSYARGATHTLPTGTVFLINPGEVHAPGPVIREGWELRAFYFTNELYAELSQNLGMDQVLFSDLFVNNEHLTRTLLSLHRSLERRGSRLEFGSKMLSALGEVAQHYAESPLRNPGRKREHQKISRAKDFLIENHRRGITLEELAKVVEFSPYHLLRTFQSIVGLTPHDFLTQVRVERAKGSLSLGNAIAEVAADTGFVDQAHLTRRFKEIVGVTPGRYLPSRVHGFR